ncbi:uridine kinase [Marininema halotolerans]|uniref:Uridine kinase n=1 Tax=Marininema halotolerans TaxID=1155944 RepID=A0A1I6NUI1_9BACL|nr:uridine kinase [Marininema halotolerans]SFS31607.1 uridine kinase [Marininema halotolerans]
MVRHTQIKNIVDSILSLHCNHPIRVGVSGITASGKTTVANEIAQEIEHRGKNVIRTSIDHFHNCRKIRYRQGKDSAKGYYEDAHDYESFRDKLLIPLGPGGDRVYQTSSFDLARDEPVTPVPKLATSDMVLVVDGTFLFKEVLANQFDYKIFVDTSFDVARKRGAQRDERSFGSVEKAEAMFIKRYHAASERYLTEHSPKESANVVIMNNDLQNPAVIIR